LKIELVFSDIKPITLNHCHKITTKGKFPTKYKTQEYTEFESKINSQLNAQKKELSKLNKAYDFQKHALSISYVFYYDILTTKGLISQKSMDLDNVGKPINDVIFKHLDMDDSQIIDITLSKRHSIINQIKVIIKLVPLTYAS
jgi:Holliday junction resolvase RusA-like endonuclease